MSILRDKSLATTGNLKIDWVYDHMPICALIEERFKKERPFEGLKITTSIHLEAKTARTALLLAAGGAEVHATGSNPLSTQDDVAAALDSRGVNVYAWYGATEQEYHDHLVAALSCRPDIMIDDGGDLTHILCEERPDLAVNLKGGSEETTTGVLRLKARAASAEGLPFPMVCVNDAMMKYMFDNRYGTGQSVMTAIMASTNLVVASKTFVVAGYGWCGKGVSMRAKGMGARVIVTEVDPVKAVEAVMDGFTVMTMEQASPLGDVFVTVTGCKDVIRMEHIEKMKDGAILCNAGHFDVEVAVAEMRKAALNTYTARNNIERFEFDGGHYVYLLAEGRLVNLAAGDGHPAEIMDISFALQVLCAEYLAKNADKLEKTIQEVPGDIDNWVAEMKLETMGVKIDRLTDEQYRYIHSAN
ncbi:MAG: adenosylhomocysteinase [Eubacteriales bacterium]|nr:adenosylhomocysteinase [Eubacteriales bacterium]